MQMDAYAIACTGGQGPTPPANVANAVASSSTSVNHGATGFSDGMHSLLAGMDGNNNRADSSSMPGGGDHPRAGSVSDVEAAARPGTKGALNRSRFLPSVQLNDS